MADDKLLMRLQKDAHCTYLSDLHGADARKDVKSAVEALPADAYPLEAWIAAVQYVSGALCDAKTADEARAILLTRLG